MEFSTYVSWSIFLVYMCARTTYACTCIGPGHIQHEFCDSDWAARVEILGKRPIQEKLVYKAKVVEDFKGKWKKDESVYLTTDLTTAACGVTNLNKTEYLIIGYKHNNLYWFDLCNYFSLWSNVDLTCQAPSLRYGQYAKNCFCQVSSCVYPGNCYPKAKGPGCDDYFGQNYRDLCEYNGINCNWMYC